MSYFTDATDVATFISMRTPGHSGWTLHHPGPGSATLWWETDEEGGQASEAVPLDVFQAGMRLAIADLVSATLTSWEGVA